MRADPRFAKFGRAWLSFAVALAIHVSDEAAHNFLSVYNPNVLAIRKRFPLLPIPTFTFQEWIVSLGIAVVLLLCLAPMARRGTKWLPIFAVPLGLLVGIANGTAHIVSSFYFWKLMPGVLSAPLILLAGIWLIREAWAARRQNEEARVFRASSIGS